MNIELPRKLEIYFSKNYLFKLKDKSYYKEELNKLDNLPEKSKNRTKELYQNTIDLIKFAENNSISLEEIRVHCFRLEMKQSKITNSYNEKPERIRKDNKDSLNLGNGNDNWNKIRFPKKCRKTAWKRFYKLFPHLINKEI